MFTRSSPYPGDEHLPGPTEHDAVFPMKFLHLRNPSHNAIEFIKHLVMVDPAARLTAADALDHEWLQLGKEE